MREQKPIKSQIKGLKSLRLIFWSISFLLLILFSFSLVANLFLKISENPANIFFLQSSPLIPVAYADVPSGNGGDGGGSAGGGSACGASDSGGSSGAGGESCGASDSGGGGGGGGGGK